MSAVLLEELAVDVLGGEVALGAVLEEVQHLQPRHRDLEALVAKFSGIAHWGEVSVRVEEIIPGFEAL